MESVTCQEILSELQNALRLKRRMPEEDIVRAISEISLFSRVVHISNALSGIVADPDDHKVLECAVVGGATHIVTGDRRHLLPLDSYQGIAIVSAADFVKLLTPP